MELINSFKLAAIMAFMVIMAMGQITFEPGSNELVCPKSGGTFCVGDSFSTPVFANCTAHGIELFDCNQILVDLEPLGKKDDAACYQVSPSAGNATCYWQGKLYIPEPVSITMTLEERVIHHVETIAPSREAEDVVTGDDADNECLIPEDDEEPFVTLSVTTTLDTRTVTEIEATLEATTTEFSDIPGVTRYPGVVESTADTGLESSAVESSAIESSASETASDPDREVDIPTITRTVITASATETAASDIAVVTNSVSPNATRSIIFTNNTNFHVSTVGISTSFSPVSFETSTIAPAGPQTSTVFVTVGGSHSNATATPSTNATYHIPDSSNSMTHRSDLAFVVLCLVVLALM